MKDVNFLLGSKRLPRSFVLGRESAAAGRERLAWAGCHICHHYKHGQMMMISPFCFWFFSVSRDAHPAVFTTKFIQLICPLSFLAFLQRFLPLPSCWGLLCAHCYFQPSLFLEMLTAFQSPVVCHCLPPALLFSSFFPHTMASRTARGGGKAGGQKQAVTGGSLSGSLLIGTGSFLSS